MVRVSKAALALVLLVPATPGYVAHGQALATSTPTPVTAPTPTTIPAGHALIELMRKAMVARRTVRVSVVSQTTWTGHSVLGWTWMDMNLQANTMREVDAIERTQPNEPSIAVTIERRELVLSGGVAASRGPAGSWYCERLRGVRVRDSLAPFQIQGFTVTNLGAAKVTGVPVWHARVNSPKAAPWSTSSATDDFYISQSDDTLIRATLNTTTRAGGHTTHYTDTETFRRYGKAITVTMPKQCVMHPRAPLKDRSLRPATTDPPPRS